MSESAIALHPHMTATQIAEWCRCHGMFVTINYHVEPNGAILPLITGRPETEADYVPMFLRRQAE